MDLRQKIENKIAELETKVLEIKSSQEVDNRITFSSFFGCFDLVNYESQIKLLKEMLG